MVLCIKNACHYTTMGTEYTGHTIYYQSSFCVCTEKKSMRWTEWGGTFINCEEKKCGICIEFINDDSFSYEPIPVVQSSVELPRCHIESNYR